MAGPSRPGTKDTVTAPSLRSTPSPVPGSQNDHVRRKSKALSLISLNKLAARQPSMTIDPAAAHYQDPGTRTTLREYVASPQKFDEALEYGFPSLGEVEENDHSELKHVPPTFLDDDKSSTHSTGDSVNTNLYGPNYVLASEVLVNIDQSSRNDIANDPYTT
ncbi:hypothetical protein ACO1O0_000638 [Amphichorda felina]